MVEGVRARGVVGPASPTRDSPRTADGSFSVDDPATSVAQKGRVSNVAGIGIEGMLALQAVDERAERDRKARKRGTAMVMALTDLQRTMLAEEDPARALHELDRLASSGAPAEDPALGAILRAIVLRSRVELARRKH
jgi:hypothetical protein